MMKKLLWLFSFVFLVSVSTLFGFPSVGCSEVVCDRDHASSVIRRVLERELELIFPVSGVKFNVNIYSVLPIRVGNNILCEVVYSLPGKNEGVLLKQILYYGDGFVFSGNLWVAEGQRFVNVTAEKLETLNRDVHRNIPQLVRETNEREEKQRYLRKEAFLEFDRIRSAASVSLTFGNRTHPQPEKEIVFFTDPFCRYCVSFKNFIFSELDRIRDRRIDVHFVFVGLSEEGERISVSVLCDIRDPRKRLDAFHNRYVSRNLCDQGRELVKKGKDIFLRYGDGGVPFLILKDKNKVEFLEGYNAQRFREFIGGF